jgi:zinc protease
MKSGMRKALAISIAILLLLLFYLLFFYTRPQEVREVTLKREILSKELANGLTVITIENHQVPLVTLVMAVKGGACTESPEFDGLSHLHEHVFVSNLAGVPERALKGVEKPYALIRGATSFESITYSFTIHGSDLKAGMLWMGHAFKHPTLRRDILEREKQVVLAEYDRNESEPFYGLSKAVAEKLWYAFPSAKDLLGNRTLIALATPEKLRKIQETYYVPNNCALIVAGDIESEEVFRLAEEAFGDWERGEDPFLKYPFQHPPLKANQSVLVIKPVSTLTLLIEFQGPSVFREPEATYPADVALYLLNNPSSRFQKNLVDSGLFSFCSISYYTQNHTGPILIIAQTTPQMFREAKDALLREINSLAKPSYFMDEEISNAKQQLEIGEIWEKEKASNFAFTIGFWWCTSSLDYYSDYVDNIRRVDRAQLADYFNTYLVNKPSVRGALLSQAHQKLINLQEEDLL